MVFFFISPIRLGSVVPGIVTDDALVAGCQILLFSRERACGFAEFSAGAS
jgi:hypothetical protein